MSQLQRHADTVLRNPDSASNERQRYKTWDALQQRPCLWKLLVGCSDEDSRTHLADDDDDDDDADDDLHASSTASTTTGKGPASVERQQQQAAAAAAAAERQREFDRAMAQGTWVVGDQHEGDGGDPDDEQESVTRNWSRPKIFTDFGGPYNCSTGKEVSPASLYKSLAGIGPSGEGGGGRLNASAAELGYHTPAGSTGGTPPPPREKEKKKKKGPAAVAMKDAVCWGKLLDVRGNYAPAKVLPCCSDDDSGDCRMPPGKWSDGCPPED